ncbi:MAG: hypothetical protein AB8B96_00925 [Lysobacterales bacterium]
MKLRQLMMGLIPLLAACQSVPLDSTLNGHELVASAGVMDYFADPSVSEVEARENIVCRRHRRVGTHMISKVCMTRDEWEFRARRTQEVQEGRMSPGCQPVIASQAYMDNDRRGALLASSCGDGMNRG